MVFKGSDDFVRTFDLVWNYYSLDEDEFTNKIIRNEERGKKIWYTGTTSQGFYEKLQT